MYRSRLNDKTRQVADGIAPDALSAHIGFYEHHLDPIGAFGALLYQASDGDPPNLLDDLELFLEVEKARLCPSPGKSAARLVWYLLQERFYDNIGVHQSLKADINYFYKISLNNGGLLEVFEIPFALDTSAHPDKGVIIWQQKERDPRLWQQARVPTGWRLLGAKYLDLPVYPQK